MRIRTILAAAAAPAALAAVLLGTAGQASAAVTQGPAAAVLTASVKQATYKMNVHQHAVADTTNVQGSATRTTTRPVRTRVRSHTRTARWSGLGVRQHGASVHRDADRPVQPHLDRDRDGDRLVERVRQPGSPVTHGPAPARSAGTISYTVAVAAICPSTCRRNRTRTTWLRPTPGTSCRRGSAGQPSRSTTPAHADAAGHSGHRRRTSGIPDARAWRVRTSQHRHQFWRWPAGRDHPSAGRGRPRPRPRSPGVQGRPRERPNESSATGNGSAALDEPGVGDSARYGPWA